MAGDNKNPDAIEPGISDIGGREQLAELSAWLRSLYLAIEYRAAAAQNEIAALGRAFIVTPDDDCLIITGEEYRTLSTGLLRAVHIVEKLAPPYLRSKS